MKQTDLETLARLNYYRCKNEATPQELEELVRLALEWKKEFDSKPSSPTPQSESADPQT